MMINEVLSELDADFAAMYAVFGRRSIAPEKLLRGMLLQIFFTIRSERQLMEQLDYNLLFRWFVGLGIDDPVWHHSTYSKNRDRLLEGDVAVKFFKTLLEHEKVKPLLSEEHFSVDGTLIEAWALIKSFVPKDEVPSSENVTSDLPKDDEPPSGQDARAADPDQQSSVQAAQGGAGEVTGLKQEKATKKSRNAEVDFHGRKWSNATHTSKTYPEAKLYRKGKGKEAKLSFMGHAMIENRHGLVVEAGMTQATGTAEREEAKAMIERVIHQARQNA